VIASEGENVGGLLQIGLGQPVHHLVGLGGTQEEGLGGLGILREVEVDGLEPQLIQIGCLHGLVQFAFQDLVFLEYLPVDLPAVWTHL
jgi:hypothetical protein